MFKSAFSSGAATPPSVKAQISKSDFDALRNLSTDLSQFVELEAPIRRLEQALRLRDAKSTAALDALKAINTEFAKVQWIGDSDTNFRSKLKDYLNDFSAPVSALLESYEAHNTKISTEKRNIADINTSIGNVESLRSRISTYIDSMKNRSSRTFSNDISSDIDKIRNIFEDKFAAYGGKNAIPWSPDVNNFDHLVNIVNQVSNVLSEAKRVRDDINKKVPPTLIEFVSSASDQDLKPGLKDIINMDGDRALNRRTFYNTYFAPALIGGRNDDSGDVKNVRKVLKKLADQKNALYSQDANDAISHVEALLDLSGSKTGLMSGLNGTVVPPSVPNLIRKLDQLARIIPKDAIASPETAAANLAAKATQNASNAPPFAGTLLYRTVDNERVLKYQVQLTNFREKFDDEILVTSVTTQLGRLNAVRKELTQRANDIKAMQKQAAENADVSYAVLTGKLRQLRQQHLSACKSLLRSVKNMVSVYTNKLLNFVRYHHGDAIAYMNYWSAVPGLADEVRKTIEKHQADCDAIIKKVNDRIQNDVVKAVHKALYSTDVDSSIVLDQDDQFVLYELNSKFAEWATEQSARVNNSFTTGPPSTIEEFMEPQQILLYSLKLLRVGIAAIAIAAAEKIFQSVYKKRVYVYDEEPPNLLWFIGLVLLIDLAIHAIVAVILTVIAQIFASSNNTFPVNRDMLMMWGFDYVISTLPIALITMCTATVLKFKKYFRYKYEGQRAIRALAKIVFYTYAVILPIPFYRMTYG
jgi:hypothetical protein